MGGLTTGHLRAAAAAEWFAAAAAYLDVHAANMCMVPRFLCPGSGCPKSSTCRSGSSSSSLCSNGCAAVQRLCTVLVLPHTQSHIPLSGLPLINTPVLPRLQMPAPPPPPHTLTHNNAATVPTHTSMAVIPRLDMSAVWVCCESPCHVPQLTPPPKKPHTECLHTSMAVIPRLQMSAWWL